MITKSLGGLSFKQIVKSSQWHIPTSQSAAIVGGQMVHRPYIRLYGDIRHTFGHVDDDIGQRLASCRALHTHRLLCNDQPASGAAPPRFTSLNEFRAEEERIEREYQRQHQEQQQKQDEANRAEQHANEDFDARDTAKVQAIRTQILDAALAHVKAHGWSREAITHGAEAVGYPGIVHGMFPNGGVELVQHFIATSNAALIEQLTAEVQANATTGSVPSPREFAMRAIRLRLEMLIPYKEQWPQALALMSLPQNAEVSLARMLTLVDDICYCAGDRSVNIDWYIRRIGIATIIKMGELHLIQDDSADHSATWTFLERRIDDGLKIQEFLSGSDKKAQSVAKKLGSAFETARNVLGINSDKR